MFDERGNVLIITALILPIMLLLLVFVVDLGIVHLARSQVQMAADAGSLAAVAVDGDEIIMSGTSYVIELDAVKAKARARNVVLENLEQVGNIKFNEKNFVYKKTGSQSYSVELRFDVSSMLLGTLFKTITHDKLSLTVFSQGEINL